LTSALSSLMMIFLIKRFVKCYAALDFQSVIGLRRNGQPWWKLVWLPAGVGLAYALMSALVLMYRQLQPATPLSEILDSTYSPFIFLGFLALAVFAAPVFEEIIFRGYFFYVLKNFKGETYAVILISIAFAVLHVDQYWGDFLVIVLIALIGLALTLLRAFCQTTIAPIIAHFCFNAGVTIFPAVILSVQNPAYWEYTAKYQTLEYREKETLLKKSIETNPRFTEAYNDLAWLYTQRKDHLGKALELIDRALLVQPRKSAFWDTKAEILHQLGRHQEAIEIEKQLLMKESSNEYFKGQLKKFETGLSMRNHQKTSEKKKD